MNNEHLSPEDRIFPICYSTARSLIRRSGEKLNIKMSPHDLRRHSATYASRNGVPLEIIPQAIGGAVAVEFQQLSSLPAL